MNFFGFRHFLFLIMAGLGIQRGYAQQNWCSLDTVLKNAEFRMIYFSEKNFIGDTVDCYEASLALLTTEAAGALLRVEQNLKDRDLGLVIYDAYRPQCAVDHFVRWAEDASDTTTKRTYYPHIPKDSLFAQGYIAEQSGHSRGSTVDLTLYRLSTGKELDMGTPIDYFGPASHPDSDLVTSTQKENRWLLREAMLNEGFEPLETEWWHFTLKDEPFPATYFNFLVE